MFYTQNYIYHTIYNEIINNLLIEKSACTHYWILPSWFHAVNRLETGLQCFDSSRFRFCKWNEKSDESKIGFGFGLSN